MIDIFSLVSSVQKKINFIVDYISNNRYVFQRINKHASIIYSFYILFFFYRQQNDCLLQIKQLIKTLYCNRAI